MEMKINEQEGVKVVQIEGNLDGNTVNDAQAGIMPLLGSKTQMVLDLKNCVYISSAGLRLLLMAAKSLTSQAGTLVLSGVCAEIMDVMEMTGFSNFFKTYGSISLAIDALKKGA
jgi:anti-anti-sigma factor